MHNVKGMVIIILLCFGSSPGRLYCNTNKDNQVQRREAETDWNTVVKGHTTNVKGNPHLERSSREREKAWKGRLFERTMNFFQVRIKAFLSNSYQ